MPSDIEWIRIYTEISCETTRTEKHSKNVQILIQNRLGNTQRHFQNYFTSPPHWIGNGDVKAQIEWYPAGAAIIGG